jgi:hypothetical protein
MEDEEDMEDEERREPAEDWEDFETMDNETAMSADIDELIGQSREIPTDWYVCEGVDASQDNGYLGNVEDSSSVMHVDHEVMYSDIPAENVLDNLSAVSTSFQPTNRYTRTGRTATTMKKSLHMFISRTTKTVRTQSPVLSSSSPSTRNNNMPFASSPSIPSEGVRSEINY